MASMVKYELIYFIQDVISLVSQGNEETILVIENHIDNGDLVSYILSQYNLERADDKSIKILDQEFEKFAGCLDGKENRKYGIVKDSDGLLLLVSIAVEILKSL